jgi:hypothetical protein
MQDKIDNAQVTLESFLKISWRWRQFHNIFELLAL